MDPGFKYGKGGVSQLSEDDLRIKDWFERLSLQERSIVLTVVDKQLVNLIFQMYRVYEEERSQKFFNRHESAYLDAHLICKVKHYNLWYKKKSAMPQSYAYTYECNQNYLKKIEGAEEVLINYVRLLNLQDAPSYAQSKESDKKKGGQGAQKKNPQIQALIEQDKNKIGGSDFINNFDTLTLDVQFIENIAYFFEMMRCVNNNNRQYLAEPLVISKDLKRLEHSVFYQESHQASSKLPPQKIPANFVTFVPKQEENREITLGQMLALIFEKAVNVHYQEYKNKSANPSRQHFINHDQIQNDIFYKDQFMLSRWLSMNGRERE